MQNLRKRALRFPLPAITVDELYDALWSYRDHMGLGLDNTGPLYFKHLPLPARQALACCSQVLIVLRPGHGKFWAMR